MSEKLTTEENEVLFSILKNFRYLSDDLHLMDSEYNDVKEVIDSIVDNLGSTDIVDSSFYWSH